MIEPLGKFYLGTTFEDKDGDGQPDFMWLDSRDLLTHALCVGMTGSGKTGLGIALLEEAAIDGIPAIVVDPKGDLGNLLLTFPDLAPADFLPWVHEDEARQKGLTKDELAAEKADIWRKGLADSAQTGERIRLLHERADLALFTPGGLFGRPLSLEGMFAVPETDDPEIFEDLVNTTASGLLHLIDFDADPIRSREHVFLSTLIRHVWQSGRPLDLAQIIQGIQRPPFGNIGVMDTETFFPEKDRFELALSLNALLASPTFAAFLQGEPFNIDRLLYSPEGKPRLSILTLSHLSEAQKMFFVTLLLNRLTGWMRTKPGTDSLRALFYMDEIFGYFPPVENPPSKRPLLTALKQARAYGLGLVLCTQNPADLDYKGLSNIGTWFIGRLTTERDRARLLEGLVDTAKMGLDRTTLNATVAALNKREFLAVRAARDNLTHFRTRFCLSYLAGPLTRDQIAQLTPDASYQPSTNFDTASPSPSAQDVPDASPSTASTNSLRTPPSAESAASPESASAISTPPQAPKGIPVHYADEAVAPGTSFAPALLGLVSVYYKDDKQGVSHTETFPYVTALKEGLVTCDWSEAFEPSDDLRLGDTPPDGAVFAALPAEARKKTAFTAWQRQLVDYLYRHRTLTLRTHKELKLLSQPEESAEAFAERVRLTAREQRDGAMDKVKERYEKRRRSLEDKLARAEERIERETEQAKDARRQTAISFGSAVLGSLLGRSIISSTSVGRASTAAKSASRSKRQQSDIGRAEEAYQRLADQVDELDADLEQELSELGERYDRAADEIEIVELAPLKRDVQVKAFSLVWLPDDTLK